MPEQEEEIEIRSDEVQEILSSVPSWMIRWGITLIFTIIFLFIILSYFIKYPDVIAGTINLTTKTPPTKMVTKTSGEIEHLFVANNEFVEEGQVIAQIKNVISKDEIQYLSNKLSEVEEGLLNEFTAPISFDNEMSFGSAQLSYNSLSSAINEYKTALNTTQFEKRKAILARQIQNYKKMDQINQRQLEYSQINFEKAEERFQSDQLLFKENVISKSDLFEREKVFNQAKNEIENLKKANVQGLITLTDYERQLNELEFEFFNKKNSLVKQIEISMSNIRNEIANWSESYEIRALISGQVNFLIPLAERQFIPAQKELLAILPEGNNYIGYMQIDKRGYGKVEVGQEVKIRFDNYPSREYGQVKGRVEEISLIPNEEKYLIGVMLTDGLTSTYKRELTYTPEMSGQADIVTEDLRILERIFNQFREIFDK